MSQASKALATHEPSQPSRMDEYTKVVQLAELRTIQLLNLDFSVVPEYYTHLPEPHETLNLGYSTGNTGYYYNAQTGTAGTFVDCEAVAKKGKKKLLSCKAHYLVSYSEIVDCDESAVKQFVDTIARFAAYPYFRSLFATLDSNAGTKLDALPLLKNKIGQREKKAPKAPRKAQIPPASQEE